MRRMLFRLFFSKEYVMLTGIVKGYTLLLIENADLRDDIRLVLHGQSPKTFKE